MMVARYVCLISENWIANAKIYFQRSHVWIMTPKKKFYTAFSPLVQHDTPLRLPASLPGQT
jgi:hypothetical protein